MQATTSSACPLALTPYMHSCSTPCSSMTKVERSTPRTFLPNIVFSLSTPYFFAASFSVSATRR
jgi:hypothetical protein